VKNEKNVKNVKNAKNCGVVMRVHSSKTRSVTMRQLSSLCHDQRPEGSGSWKVDVHSAFVSSLDRKLRPAIVASRPKPAKTPQSHVYFVRWGTKT
jgi:hypothetical protein